MSETPRQVLVSKIERILDGVAGPSLVNAVMVAVDDCMMKIVAHYMRDAPQPVQGTAAAMSKAIGEAVKNWPSTYAPLGDTLGHLSTDGDAARLRRRARIDETARSLWASDQSTTAGVAYQLALQLEVERERLIDAGAL